MKKILCVIIMWTLILSPMLILAQQRNLTISGYVRDNTDNPLFGANVFPEGLLFGAATQNDGYYTFVIPGNVLQGQQVPLVAQFMGYKRGVEVITLTPGTITVDFVLQVDVLQLDAVVVTGMGVEIPKEKLGVTIAKVEPKMVQEADQPNIVSGLL
jgi:hypothetical protein